MPTASKTTRPSPGFFKQHFAKRPHIAPLRRGLDKWRVGRVKYQLEDEESEPLRGARPASNPSPSVGQALTLTLTLTLILTGPNPSRTTGWPYARTDPTLTLTLPGSDPNVHNSAGALVMGQLPLIAPGMEERTIVVQMTFGCCCSEFDAFYLPKKTSLTRAEFDGAPYP